MTTRVLGIDPGTATTGYGIVEPSTNGRPARLVECGVIRTDPQAALEQRLHDLHRGVAELIDQHHPTTLAVENAFYGKNVRTALVLGHARGVILLAATEAGVDIVEFPPATVKKAIAGGGSATKGQVGVMVQRLLHLQTPPAPNDAADGVAIALTCLLTRRA